MHYRDNGAIGALLDEYQRSITELLEVCNSISKDELVTIVDRETEDPDCRSIQTILAHVVKAGYTYSVEIYKHIHVDAEYRDAVLLNSIEDYKVAIEEMFLYCEDLFSDLTNDQIEQYDPSLKMKMRWGQWYDIDQLMEHAIVHILRHRRQIERFLLKLRNNPG